MAPEADGQPGAHRSPHGGRQRHAVQQDHGGADAAPAIRTCVDPKVVDTSRCSTGTGPLRRSVS